MNLAYTLTENDYITFNKSHYSRSPSMGKQFARARFYMSAVFFFLPLLLIVTFTGMTYILLGVIAGILVAILIYFVYPKFYWALIAKNLKKYLRDGKSKLPWVKQALLSLEDDGMHFTIGDKMSVSPYSSIHDIVMENGAVYIYAETVQGAIIPSGVSGSDEFVSALKAKLPSNT